jgi:hypothetical protein
MPAKVLLVTTVRWFATARLAAALAECGCEVEAVCPIGHSVEAVNAVRRCYAFRSLRPQQSVDAAVRRSDPDLVVPCDDLATLLLHHLHANSRDPKLRTTIERSLGNPHSFVVVRSRARIIEIARSLGIRAPETRRLQSEAGLEEWLARNGGPLVLKADGTYGGRGVRIAETVAAARRAFMELSAPPSYGRAVKRAFVNRDGNYLLPCLQQRPAVVNVQAYVDGDDANSMVACWNGTVLSAIHVRVVQRSGTNGPASVIQLVDDVGMNTAAERLVHHLQLSGFVGLDFVVERRTGRPHLIEVNPRATQLGHLHLGKERDLSAALTEAAVGHSMHWPGSETTKDLIALFPQEWMRDQRSEYFQRAYHDVPWNAPRLVRAATARDWRSDLWSL